MPPPPPQRKHTEELSRLQPLPPIADIPGVPDGDYTIRKPDEIIVSSEGPDIVSEIWFTTPALDQATITRFKTLQLYCQCHDQGPVSDEKAGNWTWFEFVILENPESKIPRMKDDVELVWKSHFNRFQKKEYDWRHGELFPDSHPMFGLLEEGNAIGIRLCARFRGWALFAKDGYLVVELEEEIDRPPPPDYKPILENVDHLQQAFHDANAILCPAYDPPSVVGLHRADSFVGGRPLRVLALDGGGVRGISSLMLLKEVFKDIKEPPYKIFDLIAGTSTGGLIAIMLGRLKMSIDECIAAYNKFSREVFGGGKSTISWLGTKGEFYDHTKLENVVRRLVKEKLGKEDATLYESGDPECKVFVTSILADSPNNRAPVYFRSYPPEGVKGELMSAKIWEAARATSAAPNFFAPIKVGDYRFIDGGLGSNNPIGWLWNEVLGLFGPQRQTTCFLSIGTGIPQNLPLGEFHWWKNNKKYVEQFAGIATNTQLAHLLFRSLLDAYAPFAGKQKYWRLNVGEDPAEDDKQLSKKDYPSLGDLDDLTKVEYIKELTIEYAKLQSSLISGCGDRLKQSLGDPEKKA